MVDRRPTTHYGWVIVVTGFLIIFACIGLARYAYTMLLPSMQSELGLSYDRMGFIGTGNFCGYLLAALITASDMVFALLLPRPDHTSSSRS